MTAKTSRLIWHKAGLNKKAYASTKWYQVSGEFSVPCPYATSVAQLVFSVTSKMEVLRDVRKSTSGNITSSGDNGLNIRTNTSPIWDSTRYPKELAFSAVGMPHPLQMFYENLPEWMI